MAQVCNCHLSEETRELGDVTRGTKFSSTRSKVCFCMFLWQRRSQEGGGTMFKEIRKGIRFLHAINYLSYYEKV